MRQSDRVQTFSRTLRKKQTSMEKVLWHKLRGRRFHGFKFRRQVPLGPYIADFYCPEKKLVIEVDGWIHTRQKIYDRKRERDLKQRGFMIVRIENRLARNWLSVALEKIGAALEINYEKT